MSDDLHWLAESGQLEELEDRLEAGTNPNEYDDEGRTPLHIAAERSDSAILTALLGAGADVEAAEEPLPHWRALHRACLPSPVRDLGDAATVRLLLARGGGRGFQFRCGTQDIQGTRPGVVRRGSSRSRARSRARARKNRLRDQTVARPHQ